MALQQVDIAQSRIKCQHSSKLSNPYPATAESKNLVQELRSNHSHKSHLHAWIQVNHHCIWHRDFEKTKVMHKWLTFWQEKPSLLPMSDWVSNNCVADKGISLMCCSQGSLAFLQSCEILLDKEKFESRGEIWVPRRNFKSVRRYLSRSECSSTRLFIHPLLENGSWDGGRKDVDNCQSGYLFWN